jgi:hypothetical protein
VVGSGGGLQRRVRRSSEIVRAREEVAGGGTTGSRQGRASGETMGCTQEQCMLYLTPIKSCMSIVALTIHGFVGVQR